MRFTLYDKGQEVKNACFIQLGLLHAPLYTSQAEEKSKQLANVIVTKSRNSPSVSGMESGIAFSS